MTMVMTCDCFNEVADVKKLFAEYHKLLCEASPAAAKRYGQSCDHHDPCALWDLH